VGRVLVVALDLDDSELSSLVVCQREQPGMCVIADSAHPALQVILLAGDDGQGRAFLPRAQLSSGPEPPQRGGRRREPVEVRVLGAIEVVGVDPTLGRHPRLTELVAYFAMHPGGSTSRTWTGALWPERRVPQQTVANRLSEARRLLGFAADDLPRLRRNGERHLLVEVTTDWAHFGELAAEREGPESWHHALELVRGRPFGDLAEGQWTVLEGFVAEMEQAVAATALRLGAHALASGDPDEAVFAARQALRAAPYDERLHRLLMRAADKAGNRAGVEGVLQQLALMLEIDGDPLGGVHPETAALYEQLSGRGRSFNAG
jgi:DNA-binding SARP family transcriptional activator